jgi:hypothetical protein
MIFLTATTDTLEVVTAAAGSVDVTASYNDINTTTYAPVPGRADSSISAAATSVVVAAPAASTARQIKFVSISNKAAVAQAITVQINANGTRRSVGPGSVILQAGEAWIYEDARGISVLDPFARPKQLSAAAVSNWPSLAAPAIFANPDNILVLSQVLAELRIHSLIMTQHFGIDLDLDNLRNDLNPKTT